MSTTATVTISGTLTGRAEGGSDQFFIKLTNTSAASYDVQTTATTAQATATLLTAPTSAKFLLIEPPSTNRNGLRLTGSTAEAGIPLSSVDPTFLSIASSVYFVYTTGTDPVPGIRIVFV
jgi:hypothetical protein